jgi:hypothetical protein
MEPKVHVREELKQFSGNCMRPHLWHCIKGCITEAFWDTKNKGDQVPPAMPRTLLSGEGLLVLGIGRMECVMGDGHNLDNIYYIAHFWPSFA